MGKCGPWTACILPISSESTNKFTYEPFVTMTCLHQIECHVKRQIRCKTNSWDSPQGSTFSPPEYSQILLMSIFQSAARRTTSCRCPCTRTRTRAIPRRSAALLRLVPLMRSSKTTTGANRMTMFWRIQSKCCTTLQDTTRHTMGPSR